MASVRSRITVAYGAATFATLAVLVTIIIVQRRAAGLAQLGEEVTNTAALAGSIIERQSFRGVAVDTATGLVKVVRMLAIQDCGTVIAKKLAESQVLGAMIQGLSYALHERRIMDAASGRMLNGDFLRYKIAGSQDLPQLDCVMMSVANGHSSVPAAGLGEPPSVAAPAAVANAVFHALGVPLRHLPITPDKVLAALAKRRG